MIAKVRTATLLGINALEVTVEAGLAPGLPHFTIVGLADTSVQESKERIPNALRSCGFTFPAKRISVNLAPADTRKEGPALDLPIALAVLCASGQLPQEVFDETIVVGELGLDGVIRGVNGVVSIALLCRELGVKRLIVPEENATEASVANEVDVFPVSHLKEVYQIMRNPDSQTPMEKMNFYEERNPEYGVDFNDVKGQAQAKRALEIAAAGGHNVLMIGSPGSGKTMLARRLPTILPPLYLEEAIEVTRIYSTAGMMNGRKGLIWERPFRAPHHGASHAAIVGGGKVPKPGQISLAHHGVLFMDEMPEFDRNVLEGLRQPLEDGVVTVARVQASLDYPAEFILISAMNPCPCGYHGDRFKNCACSFESIRRYMNRISGPLLDRIDLHVEVPRLTETELLSAKSGESSKEIAERVNNARQKQSERFENTKTQVNARMNTRELRELCLLSDDCKEFLSSASSRLGFSARVFDRVIKVSRTIADLKGDKDINVSHLSEAIQYRSLDRVFA